MSAAGKRHVGAMLAAGRAAGPNVRQATAEFEAMLDAELPEPRTAAQVALKVSAVALYCALFGVQQRLKGTYKLTKLVLLAEQASVLSGSLTRSLRALGLSAERDADKDAGPDTAPTGGIADWTKRWRRERGDAEPAEDAEREGHEQ